MLDGLYLHSCNRAMRKINELTYVMRSMKTGKQMQMSLGD